MSHPEHEQLLRYADGESPAAAANKIRLHLEACWECRADLEDLQKTVSDSVRYRKNVLARYLPPPPAPWPDIYRGFAEIDAALDRASLWRRTLRGLQTPFRNSSGWAPVGVALIVACLLLYRFHQTPSVQAAELLRKAIAAAADNSPGKTRRIQIRTKHRSVTRLVGAQAKVVPAGADAEALRSLQGIFQSAHYDWNDPLSAKSYQAWRDQLQEKRDEVIEDRGAYLIRTSTFSGELTAATLRIRMPDLQPVEGRLEFRNKEWVEITELSGMAGATLVEIVAVGSPAIAVKRPAAAVSSPASSATISDELRVLAALHQVGADLGDPIEVSRRGGEILVTGVGIALQRQREIHDALGSQAGVVVRFSGSTPASIEPETEAPTDSTAPLEIQQLQARLAERIGGREYFSQLAAQVLDLSEPMMSRAYALRRLAERFPVESESELSADDRRVLRGLQREHTEALRRHIAELERLLKPVLEPAQPDTVISSDVWQRATAELFQSARQVEKLLAVIFGAAVGESSGEQLPNQLSLSLSQLGARLEAYERVNK